MNCVYYMVVDTETATLPFVNEIAQTDAERKKIAIAKPLVYDIGWVIANRSHGIIERKSYLVAETFCVPYVFNTAYYREKRPLYLTKLQNSETQVKTWDEILEIFIADLEKCKYVCAYNAMFDFCKAIPFTEQYIRALYSQDYHNWESQQKTSCNRILDEPNRKGNPNFENEYFILREQRYNMIDIWGLACQYIINNANYKRECLKRNYLTNSGIYFSTTAENTKRFLEQQFDFIESHTALEDAEIETAIMLKALKRGKIIRGIMYFPFRALGDVADFVIADTKVTDEMRENVIAKMRDYVDKTDKETAFKNKVIRQMNQLLEM